MNEMIMNITPGETRIARLENGVLSELSIERDSDVQIAGNIYFGRINRVLPGMQAAFVDIGLEKAAFLYVADIVPDLFEGFQDDDVEIKPIGNGGGLEVSENGLSSNESADRSDSNPTQADPSDDDNGSGRSMGMSQEPPLSTSVDSPETSVPVSAEEPAPIAAASENRDTGAEAPAAQQQPAGEKKYERASRRQPRQQGRGGRDGGRGRDGRGRDNRGGGERENNNRETNRDAGGRENNGNRDNNENRDNRESRDNRGNRDNRGGERDNHRDNNRDGNRDNQGKSQAEASGRRLRRGPLPRIENLVKEGQTIVVQIAKEPIRNKGARVTSHISLPGRYLVYMPTVNHVGVSRRVGSPEERQRLKEFLHKNKPATGGFIARTNCVGAPEDKLLEDMANLQKTWQEIYERQEKAKPPALLYADMDIILRAVRDNLSHDVNRLVLDSVEDYKRVTQFTETHMPDLTDRIQLYDKETPLFDVYGIENEINRALGKKVWLKSGGYLVIDSSEALTAVDVNTGRFVGKKDFDETVITTNLEAVDEIAYQLKLRSLGGIIIIDFIDMGRYSDRAKIYHALKEALKRDRVKTTISKISDLGLIEMTRKRTRDALVQTLSETCEHCNGTGMVKTPLTVAFEVFREIRRVYSTISSRNILVRAHPRVVKTLFNEGRAWLDQLEKRLQKRIMVETDEKFHVAQIEIRGRDFQQVAPSTREARGDSKTGTVRE